MSLKNFNNGPKVKFLFTTNKKSLLNKKMSKKFKNLLKKLKSPIKKLNQSFNKCNSQREFVDHLNEFKLEERRVRSQSTFISRST